MGGIHVGSSGERLYRRRFVRPTRKVKGLSDLGALADRVERALPVPQARVPQLTALVDSLEHIASHNGSLLIVQVRSDRIRLFAGRLIVLTLSKDHIWLATEPSFMRTHLSGLGSWEWDQEVYPRYRRPPSLNGFYYPLLDRSGDWLAVQAAHFAYLDQC